MSDHRMTEEQLRDLIRDTVAETLVRLGMENTDPLAMQRDFAFLRQWREATTSIKKKGMMTVVGLVVSGLCAAAWLGVRAYLATRGVHAPSD